MVFSMCMSLMCIAALVIGAEDLKPRSKRQYLEFNVLSQKQLVVKMGQNAVLKYELDPADTAQHVKLEVKCYWSKSEIFPENMCLSPTLPQLSFNKRIYLVKDYINQGYVELRIDDVELSDEGTYSCCFRAPNRVHDASTHLSVEANGSPRVITIRKTPDGRIDHCITSNCYQEPEKRWKGSSGETQTSEPPSGNLTFTTAVNDSCQVKKHLLNRTEPTTGSGPDFILSSCSSVPSSCLDRPDEGVALETWPHTETRVGTF